jgi:hypothetical protein
MRVMVWCEAESDFRVAAGLLDRAVREEHAQSWVRELMDSQPEVFRSWQKHFEGQQDFFNVHQHAQVAKHYGVPPQRGYFDGRPGSDGARMARSILTIAGHLRRKRNEPIDIVVLVWDMDGQATERKAGLEQAREPTARPPGCDDLKIVYGCPDFEMEAWLLCGFEPKDDDERRRFEELRERLSFDPVTQSHRLTAKRDDDQGAPNDRSVKVALSSLTEDDHERAQACWQEAPLHMLRQRGEHNGLRDYLEEVLRGVDQYLATSTNQNAE